MKRICIFALLMMMISSCSIMSTTLVGDVTMLSSDGNSVKTWEDVVLQQEVMVGLEPTTSNAMKSFGINFYHEESNKFIVLSEAVPYVIEYTVENNKLNKTNKKDKYKPSDEDIAAQLTDDYFMLEDLLKANKKQMKGLSINSKEYESLQKENEKIQNRMSDLEECHKALVNRDIVKYYNGF